jgi:hypothetical protein
VARKRYQPPERRTINEYRGACEGNQENFYFKHLKELINREEQRKHDVNFSFICTNGGSPLVVAKRADVAYAGSFERFAAFDYDGKHEEFISALDFCDKKKIICGYCNFCFDLWLLSHKIKFLKGVLTAQGYEAEVRSTFGLPAEADIKGAAVIKQILSQISLEDIRKAIKNAQYIIQDNNQVKVPQFTSKSIKFFDNPDLSIHIFVEKVLKDAGL